MENERLHDQAGALVELLHRDTEYPSGCLVLEAGVASALRQLPWPAKPRCSVYIG
jgi:hypothetical protein